MSIKTTVSISAAALAALTLLTPMSASAQRGGGGGQPAGSYAQSCSDIRVDGGRLYAECGTGIGRDTRYSSIEYGRCVGDVANNRGMLFCNGAQGRLESRNGGGNTGGGNNGGGRQPTGSFTQSCNNIRTEGGRLYAQCQDVRGNRNLSSIEYGRCNSDINNINGLLSCNGATGRFENDGRPGTGGGNNGGGWGGGNGPGNGGPGNGGPGGGWGGRNSITVYEDSNFRGGSATFNGEMPNLGRRQLNDNISSMQMNGTWEACSDPYFRGTCQTFSGDVRNLNNTLINDRISSLRPVRGW
ncbi:beta/gamma crystallin-related protein [Brevundimonas goettingensis]|uniref:Beta/gamma crystallin 'Greek key' domain-containing protein n=1 Tax=Brevundimonas goettingensis TaxID=2774190 RepID=A0A975C3I3_9CAUL|nr:beta/gamma crystallin-related protein [Brevundimonas goettingensis]QTC91789.1 hypothetical protein IFJ75_02320 [Brevundimonas goettingensis]